MATITGKYGIGQSELLTGTAGNDIIDGAGGNDRIDGGGGTDTALFFDSQHNFSLMTLTGITHVRPLPNAKPQYYASWYPYDIVMTNVETAQFTDGSILIASGQNTSFIFGQSSVGSSENLTGTAGNDTIDGKGGNDRINGGGGTDTAVFFDARSNFVLTTLSGVTHLHALEGGDPQYYSSSYPYDAILTNVEVAQFLDGNVSLASGQSTSFIIGQSSIGSSERLTGTAGNDIIDGAGGNDRIDGGGGTDTALFFDSQHNFSLMTLTGITHVRPLPNAKPQYYASWYPYDIVMTNVETAQFTDGSILIASGQNTSFIFGQSSVGSSENLTGTAGNDTIDGKGGNDRINGGGGTDTAVFFDARSNFVLTTLSGVTHLHALEGGDPQYYSSSYPYDAILTNVEVAQFLDGNVSLASGQSTSFIIGQSSIGSSERLTGTAGNDIIDGAGGNDRIDGGGGTDTALFFDSQHNFSLMTLTGITHVRPLPNAKPQYYASWYPYDIVMTNVETAQFTDGSILIASGQNTSFIFGQSSVGSSENLTGTAGNDTIDGKGGNDRINGGGGTDTAVFFENRRNFEILTLNGETHITALKGADPQYYSSSYPYDAILQNVEILEFLDATIWIGPLDNTPPTATNFSPVDAATGVAVDSNLVVTFSEPVQRGTGNIVLKTAASAVVATYDVATSSNLSIVGSTLVVNPTLDLPAGTQYFVNFAAGTIKDLAGNSFAGTTAYDFTTAAAISTTPTTGNDKLTGTTGPDRMTGLAGNDDLDGGSGIDTAIYSVTRTAANFFATQAGYTVTAGPDGTDTIKNIERLQFSDNSVALDLSGNAGAVAKILGAVFGKAEVANEVYAGIGLYYVDGGMSYLDLMQLAIDARLGAGASNQAVVDLLYSNVAGQPPSDIDRAAFVGLLDSHQFTPATLGVLAADHELNLANIDMVGLATQGLEFVPFGGG